MKKYFKYLFCIILSICVCATNAQDCDYSKLIKDGRILYTKGDYGAALNKFNAARTCDISKSSEADIEINKVFSAIQKQRDEAISAKIMAERNAKEAQEAKQEAQRQTILTEKAKEEAEKNLGKANSLVKALNSKDTLEIDATRSFILAYESVKLDTTSKSLEALINASYKIHFKHEVKFLNKINKISYSSNIDQMAIAEDNGWIRLWDIGKDTSYVLISHPNISALCYSDDGKLLISAGEDGLVKMWSVSQKKFQYNLKLPSATYTSIRFFSKDTLIACSLDGRIRFYDLNSNAYVSQRDIYIDRFFELIDINICAKLKLIAVQSAEGIAVIKYDGKILFRYDSPDINSMDFSPDGQVLSFSQKNGKIFTYNIEENKLASFTLNVTTYIQDIKYISDLLILTVNDEGIVSVIDLLTQKQITEYRAYYTKIKQIIFDNKKMLLFSSSEKVIRIWDGNGFVTPIQRYIPVFSDDVSSQKDTLLKFYNNAIGQQKFINWSANPFQSMENGFVKKSFKYSNLGIEYISSIFFTAFGQIENISFEIFRKKESVFSIRILSDKSYLDKIYISENRQFILISTKDLSKVNSDSYYLFYTIEYMPILFSKIKFTDFPK